MKENKVKKEAQSVLEYALLLTVGLAIVLVAGTYVKRATQAGLRNVEDQVNLGEGYLKVGNVSPIDSCGRMPTKSTVAWDENGNPVDGWGVYTQYCHDQMNWFYCKRGTDFCDTYPTSMCCDGRVPL